MSDPRPRTLHDLLLLSDFGRANPERARELLERAADPLTEERNEPRKEHGRAQAA